MLETQKKSYYSPDTIAKILPQRLKYFRKRIGFTTSEVAKILNKTPSAITLWETGKALPDVVILLKLCCLYKVSDLNEFLEFKVAPDVTSLAKNEQKLISLYRSVPRNIQAAVEVILEECS